MFHHVVLYRLKPDVTLDRVRQAREALQALVETLPGVHFFDVTHNVADDGGAYRLALFAGFDDRQAYTIFRGHPEARRVLDELLAPVILDQIVAEGEGDAGLGPPAA